MKVVFCGSRTWDDEQAIWATLMKLPRGITVITGGAPGADSIAHKLASNQLRFQTKVMKADWETHGRKAGYVRNCAMLDEKPVAVWAFWDGRSKGTQHTIREAVKRRIDVHVVFSSD